MGKLRSAIERPTIFSNHDNPGGCEAARARPPPAPTRFCGIASNFETGRLSSTQIASGCTWSCNWRQSRAPSHSVRFLSEDFLRGRLRAKPQMIRVTSTFYAAVRLDDVTLTRCRRSSTRACRIERALCACAVDERGGSALPINAILGVRRRSTRSSADDWRSICSLTRTFRRVLAVRPSSRLQA
jgi:hypothetical protein